MSMNDLESDTMSIVPLGGGQEVGRSCILLQYRGRNIMLDCGSHPGREGNDSLPFFDSIDDPADIDFILITHFHIDHCAALPYFTEKTDFRGKIYMTHATKAVMKLLLSDNIRLQTRSKPLYTEQELQSCIDKIDVLSYHQTIERKGAKITATAAGHVLGAAMFTIEIDGVKVLYTGDYSTEADRHLVPGCIPPGSAPDVLIVESTFGVTTLPPRLERESRFTSVAETIVSRGGSCLIPVFALGRAQELLLILDEYWQANPQLNTIPVFYASRLASKALRVYQTFVNTMSDHIRTLMDISNPFKFKSIRNMIDAEFDTIGPCVVMASPGFMQSGVSRQLFERWCDDERNGVIIAGYTVEGTLAHDLLSLPKEITCSDNRIKQRRCLIEHISFSAHVDYSDNRIFIRSVTPDNIILVHGEKTGMKRLKDELDREIGKNWPVSHKPSVAMPENGVRVKIRFNKPIIADAVGYAASSLLEQINRGNEGNIIEGTMLVMKDFTSKVVTCNEISNFTSCRMGKITQKFIVPVPPGYGWTESDRKTYNDTIPFVVYAKTIIRMLIPYLEELFDELVVEEDGLSLTICNIVKVNLNEILGGKESQSYNSIITYDTAMATILTWDSTSGYHADTIADAVVGTISQAYSIPTQLRLVMGFDYHDNKDHLIRKGKDDGHSDLESFIGSRRPRELIKNHQNINKRLKEDSNRLELFIERMKRGVIDPSKHIPAEYLSIYNHHDNINEPEGNLNDVKRKHEQKLMNLINLIHQSKFNSLFSSMSLNVLKDKIIFRSQPRKRYAEDDNEGILEAYCFVVWGNYESNDSDQNSDSTIISSMKMHNAVVYCDDDMFRDQIISTLKSLDSSSSS